jgi:hypothetical protein
MGCASHHTILGDTDSGCSEQGSDLGACKEPRLAFPPMPFYLTRTQWISTHCDSSTNRGMLAQGGFRAS